MLRALEWSNLVDFLSACRSSQDSILERALEPLDPLEPLENGCSRIILGTRNIEFNSPTALTDMRSKQLPPAAHSCWIIIDSQLTL